MSRGKDMSRLREEVKRLRNDFRDWKEEVEEIRYILGVEVEEVRSFAVDLKMKRLYEDLRKRVNGLGDLVLGMSSGMKGGGEGKGEKNGVREKVRGETMEREVVVEGGRSYSEVLKGVKVGVKGKEIEEMEEQKEKERRVMEEVMKERERKSLVVEVVLDSQEVIGSESSWSSERMEEEMGLVKGEVKRVVGKKGKVRVEVESGEGVDKLLAVKKGRWKEVLGKEVREVRSMDVWAGLVIPGVEIKVWKGKLKELRKGLEEQVGMKLMIDPFWLVSEEKAVRIGLKYVGVVVYVVREGERSGWRVG